VKKSQISPKAKSRNTKKQGSKSRRKRGEAQLKVAYLTTNPDLDSPLRTDIEIRDVLRAIRRTENRDKVEIKHLPAASFQDLLDALNEFRPTVLHFSGHAGGQHLSLDWDDIDSETGFEIDYELISDVLEATEKPPRLLLFNACDTAEGAEMFLNNVDAVIVMSDKIGDAAAAHFAVQFYLALVSGQPIDKSVEQGKLVLKAAGSKDFELPKILVKNGLIKSKLKFVTG